MKLLILSLAALLTTGSVFAADPVIHDKTGFFVHLDVDKVLSRVIILRARDGHNHSKCIQESHLWHEVL